MRQTEITLVTNEEDWEGVYVNGKLVCQGHTIRVEELLLALGFNLEEVTCDYDWLDGEGYLPENLIDIVRVDGRD